MTVFRVALLGAESTGKTALAQAIAAPDAGHGWPVTVLPEVLRRWCDQARRTPRQHEQAAIAQAQADQLLAAPAEGLVLADTTPLMVAVYSDLIFGDHALYPMALDHHRHYDLTLLMGLDLPWVADGLQRDGPQVRAPVDARLRAVLGQAGMAYATVYGQGQARTRQAVAAIASGWQRRDHPETAPSEPVWVCGECSDPDCEHRLFTDLLRQRQG